MILAYPGQRNVITRGIHYNLYILTQAFTLHSQSMYLLFHNLADAATSWWFSLFLILSSSMDQLDLFSYTKPLDHGVRLLRCYRLKTQRSITIIQCISCTSVLLGDFQFLHSPTLHKPSSVGWHVSKAFCYINSIFLVISLSTYSPKLNQMLSNTVSSYFFTFFMLPLLPKFFFS